MGPSVFGAPPELLPALCAPAVFAPAASLPPAVLLMPARPALEPPAIPVALSPAWPATCAGPGVEDEQPRRSRATAVFVAPMRAPFICWGRESEGCADCRQFL